MMKYLLLAVWIGIAVAKPQPSSDDLDSMKIEGLFAISCIVENWNDDASFESNMIRIDNCNKCFDEIEEPLSEDGINSGKTCFSTYLPNMDAACAEELNLLAPEQLQPVKPLLQCMGTEFFSMVAERCLGMTDGNNVQEKLVDGVLCERETFVNISYLVQYMVNEEQANGGKGLGAEILPCYLERFYHGNMKERIIYQGYCNLATGGDNSRDASCKTCVADVTDYASFKKCKDQYFMPAFQVCIPALNALEAELPESTEMIEPLNEAEKCMQRVLTKNLVDKCSIDVYTVTTQTLVDVTKCTQVNLMQMAFINVRPEIISQLQEQAPSAF